MAQPAPKLEPDDYNEPGEQSSGTGYRPDLKAIDGQGQTTPRSKDHLQDSSKQPVEEKRPTYDRPGNVPETATDQHPTQKTPWRPWNRGQSGSPESPKQAAQNLKDKEDSTDKGAADKTGAAVPKAERSLYKPSPGASSETSRLKNLFRTRRRKILGIGGITGTIIGLFFGFSILQGPLQLIHLSQILGKNFFGNQQTSSTRYKGLFRYARSGDIGETRLNLVGSRIYRGTLSQLRDLGFEFRKNSFGVPNELIIDTSKNEYKGIRNLTLRERLLSDFEIKDASILTQVDSDRWSIKLDATSVKGMNFTKMLVKTSIGKLGDGAITSAMQTRFVRTAFGLPKLFSPLSNRVKAKVSAQFSAADAAKAERERQAKLQEPGAQKVSGARAKVKGFLQSNKGKVAAIGASTALAASALLCEVRGLADDAVTVNRGVIVLPGVVNATDKIAVGSQGQSGQGGFTSTELGAVANSLIDENGQSIWQAKALQATAGTANPTGPDLPTGIGAAFSNSTTADKIRNEVQIKVSGVDATGFLCSTPGLIVQGVASIVLLAAGAFTFGGSWGLYAAQQGAALAATATVLFVLHQQLAPLLEDKAVIPETLSGPLGGNILAYSGRELGNIVARSSGGVELSDSESAMLDSQQRLADQQDFNSKSLASKLFDVHDYRSLASKVVDGYSPSIQQNIAKLGSVFTNFGSIFSTASKLFTPLTHAEPQPYDWGFARYGIPQSLAEDPKYENPYANGEEVAKLLAADSSYISRAKSCFGVDISKDSGVWSVIAKDDVNPGSSDYTSASCDDGSENWHRIMLFVADSRLADAMACWEGDEDSCTQVGFGQTSGSTGTAPSTTPSVSAPPLTSLGGQQLDATQTKWIKYIAENVVPNLGGSADANATMAANGTWWSLREGVLSLDNPIGYSNCGTGSGNTHINFTDVCPPGYAWQVGLAAVQVPNPSASEVIAKAQELHPGSNLKDILGQVSTASGHPQGDPEYDKAVNSSGDLQKSLLLRDSATGFFFVDKEVVNECLIPNPKSWCIGNSFSSNQQSIINIIAELKTYFQGSGSTTAPSTTPSGTATQLAQQILNSAKAGHIKFNVLSSSDITDGSTPEQNIQQTANGQLAHTTSSCGISGRGAQAPVSVVALSTNLLAFIQELSQVQDIQINALAGQCHGEITSNHYQGKAVDFGCPFNAFSADQIGTKYNISDLTGETCSNSGHYHYSIGGH
ncbi:hypothetical protein HYW35_02215 [Candidatus Saccharibacteria bacterium]|nr:hypothetical protein [Candidatus Saccharibacteria bacterium]